MVRIMDKNTVDTTFPLSSELHRTLDLMAIRISPCLIAYGDPSACKVCLGGCIGSPDLGFLALWNERLGD